MKVLDSLRAVRAELVRAVSQVDRIAARIEQLFAMGVDTLDLLRLYGVAERRQAFVVVVGQVRTHDGRTVDGVMGSRLEWIERNERKRLFVHPWGPWEPGAVVSVSEPLVLESVQFEAYEHLEGRGVARQVVLRDGMNPSSVLQCVVAWPVEGGSR